jgi:2-amino-4-hydroxy-6-hydroxymethyldihydropteridine diphosphokinase
MKALIALGANIGDRHQNLRIAVQAIHKHPKVEVLQASRLYECEPIGGPSQGDFLNGVILVDTELEPLELLDFLHKLENESGRDRREHWGPRPLDLDIVDVEGFKSDSEKLTVPHPRVADREFVLRPIADIDDSWVIFNRPVSQWLGEIEADPNRPLVAIATSALDWWS